MEEKPSEWGGYAPKVEVEYDSEHWYIFAITIFYSKAVGKLKASELRAKMMDELREWDLVEEPDFMTEENSDDED